jgi:hypothetical protein
MGSVRGGEDEGSRGDTLIGEAVVDVVRGQEADAAVTVLVVVPVEERAAVGAAVLGGSEALGKVGPVLERLELGLGEWVVVRDVRPRVALRDAEVGVQMRNRLRGHRRPAVSVDGKLAGGDSLPLASLFDELLGERCALAVGDHPADDVAAEDVEDDVQVQVGPLRRAKQLRDVPAPHLVRRRGEKLRLLVGRVPQLIAPLSDLGVSARIRYIVRSEQR